MASFLKNIALLLQSSSAGGAPPAFRKKTGGVGLLAEPKRGPEVSAVIIVLGQTVTQTSMFQEALTANALKPVGQPLPDLLEHRVGLPHLRQTVPGSVSEDQFRDMRADAAEGVGAVGQHPHDAAYSTGTPEPIPADNLL
jgi:hypothetical protein